MRTVRTIVSAALVVALPLPGALADVSNNPLLGRWQLIDETDLQHVGGHCATGMIFEAKQQTVFQGAQSSVGNANYFARNGMIVVSGENASTESGLLSYRFDDNDHMERRDYLLCRYQRSNPTQASAPTKPGCPSQEELWRLQNPPPGTQVTYEDAMTVINCTP